MDYSKLADGLDRRHSEQTNAPENRDTYYAWAADAIRSLIEDNNRLREQVRKLREAMAELLF